MNGLKISNYKGISKEVAIDLPSAGNLVLYGDNGSGKTSLFDAVRLWHFGKDLKLPELGEEVLEVQASQMLNEWLTDQKCRFGGSMDIRIDGTALDIDTPSNVPAFMLKGTQLSYIEEISLSRLVSYKTVHCPEHVNVDWTVVSTRITEVLQEYFLDDLKVSVAEYDADLLTLKDNKRGIEATNDLHSVFNESRIRIVRLVAFLEHTLAYMAGLPQSDIRPILVLDDFVTSLDVSNRIGIIRYLIDRFGHFQIVLLTHNVSYFNLIHHMVKEYGGYGERWRFGNLFMIDRVCEYYNFRATETVSAIKEYYTASPDDVSGVSNRLRRRFEILVHEFAKLTVMDTHTIMDEMLKRLLEDKPVYLKPKVNNEYAHGEELVTAIRRHIVQHPDAPLVSVENIIRQYDTADKLNTVRQWLRKAKMYQKVVMHQGSHGQEGAPTITPGEIEYSVHVLRQLEIWLEELRDFENVYDV